MYSCRVILENSDTWHHGIAHNANRMSASHGCRLLDSREVTIFGVIHHHVSSADLENPVSARPSLIPEAEGAPRQLAYDGEAVYAFSLDRSILIIAGRFVAGVI